MDQKTVEIHLPYFKQGDDLKHCLENTDTIGDAFALHADMLAETSKALLQIKELTTGYDVEIQADGHMILITGPVSVMDLLIEKEVAEELGCCDDDWGDDDEWDEFDDGSDTGYVAHL